MLYLGVPWRSGPVHKSIQASGCPSAEPTEEPSLPSAHRARWGAGILGQWSDPDSGWQKRGWWPGFPTARSPPSLHLFPFPGAHPQGVPRLILQPLAFLPQTHFFRAAPRAHLLLDSSQDVYPTQLWDRGGEARGAREGFLRVLGCPRGLHI